MYKALARTPLQQTVWLLWLIGLVRLATWLGQAPPSWRWVASAALGAVLLLVLGARSRLLTVLPIAAALGLATALAAGHLLGASSPDALARIACAYALTLWAFTVAAPRTSAALGRTLGWSDDYRPRGTAPTAEHYVYYSSYVFLLGGVAWAAADRAAAGAVPAVDASVLALSLVFLVWSGRRYTSAMNTYLACVLALLGFFDAAARFLPEGTLAFTNPSLAFLLAIASAFASGGSNAFGRSEGATTLYVRPLRDVAACVALLAVLQVGLLGLYGLHAAPGWDAVVGLGLAGVVLLRANRSLQLGLVGTVGAMSTALAILWAYTAGVYASLPFDARHALRGDVWLVVAAISLVTAAIGQRLYRSPDWREPYGRPFLGVAVLAFGLSIAGVITLFPTSSVFTPWLVLTLVAVQFPLLRPLEARGVEIRGVTVALSLSVLVAAVLGPEGRAAWGAHAALLWAFVLWAMGVLVLPRANARRADWAVDPVAWPWLGLASLGIGIIVAFEQNAVPLWGSSLIAAGYLTLMLRHTDSEEFAWSAAAAVTAGGVLFSFDRYDAGLATANLDAIGGLAFENLIVANVLFGLAALSRRLGANPAARVAPRLHVPLASCGFAVATVWLFGVLLWDVALLSLDLGNDSQRALAAVLGTVLVVTLLHGYAQWPRRVSAHLLVAGIATTAIAAWGIAMPFELPLALAFLAAATVAARAATADRDGLRLRVLGAALGLWAPVLCVVAFAAAVALAGVSIEERVLTLAVLAAVALVQGARERSAAWLNSGALLSALVVHGLWFLWIPPAGASVLVAVWSLQSALIVGVLRGVAQRAAAARAAEAETFLGTELAASVLGKAIWAGSALAVVEYALHFWSAVSALSAGATMQGFVPVWSHAAAAATPIVLTALCALEARRSSSDRYVYAGALLATAAGVYGRLLLVGLAPVGIWDTGAILTAAYMLLALRVVTGSRAVSNVAMVVPVLALITVPLQFGSMHATLSLFAIGTLYLLSQHGARTRLSTYLALLAMNAGLYLWVPNWSSRFGLLQVYVVPAALTVLLLLRLHRNELKREVLNGSRLAAMSALYAVAFADVFVNDNFWVFVLALLMTLVGIAIGIAARVRAFLYSSVAFLVLNVLGQLAQMYPEERLSRAIVLMALGVAITAAMISFTLKREAIMQRLRIARADLAQWA